MSTGSRLHLLASFRPRVYLSTSQKEKLQRRRIWRRQRGLCFYCKRPTHLNYPAGGAQPDDLATIDHLDDRLSPERGQHAGEFRRVVACFGCNQKRNAERMAEVGLEELRRRSGHAPREGRGES